MVWRPVVSSIDRLIISGYVPHTDVTDEGIIFSTSVPEGEKAELLLYEKGRDEVKCEIPFPSHSMIGRVAAMMVSGIPAGEIEYNYRIGGRIVTDPAAQTVSGLERFGDRRARGPHQVRGGFADQAYDWEGDEPIRRPYCDSVFYELHVRGFTEDESSRIRHRGSFAGVAEKVPYLRSLGITAVVLMPCYEFDEIVPDTSRIGWRPQGLRELMSGSALPPSALRVPDTSYGEEGRTGLSETSPQQDETPGRLNFWGFGPAWYFAPKHSYSASGNPGREFRDMVKELHRAGIEVIMEMHFPRTSDPAYMQAALLWWKQVYHVDGFFLMADRDALSVIGRSAALADTKLISEYFPADRMYPEGRPYAFRNLAECNFGFRIDGRRLLKGDPGVLGSFVQRSRRNPKDEAIVNAITDHDGFTLMDLVSYNDPHNGQDGRGGGAERSEFSWNCGSEGPSRKKEVRKLRMRQIRNALCLMMLSQGSPMLRAGDECGNSQQGSSNPWCIDSELSWVKWSGSKSAKAIHSFARRLIEFRKSHRLLHQNMELTGSSMGGFFPQFSMHGVNAWFASFDSQDRSVGLMYSGQDGSRDRPEESYLYVAYNFHWEDRQLALPFLPGHRRWHLVIDTFRDTGFVDEEPEDGETAGSGEDDMKSITVPGRTVWVLEG